METGPRIVNPPLVDGLTGQSFMAEPYGYARQDDGTLVAVHSFSAIQPLVEQKRFVLELPQGVDAGVQ